MRMTTMHATPGNGPAARKNALVMAAVVIALLMQNRASAVDKDRPASTASTQGQALNYIERLAATRNAGAGVLLAEVGANVSVASADKAQGGYLPAKTSTFGNIRLSTAVTPQSDTNPTVLLTFEGGCVKREQARQRFQFKEVVASPGPEDLHPVVGYGFYLQGSAVSLYFDTTRSNCLTAARIEAPSALTELFRKRDEQTRRLEESKAFKRAQQGPARQ